MKRIAPILLLSAVGFGATIAIDASVTRAQLLQMFHAANRATDRNIAIKKWSEIIQEAPGLPKPYLQIAKLYDEDTDNAESRDLAMLFYRKYIDIEMDPVELAAAEKRLEELEAQTNAPSFRDYLKSQADSIDNVYAQIDAEVKTSTPQATVAQQVEEVTPAPTTTPAPVITPAESEPTAEEIAEAGRIFDAFADSISGEKSDTAPVIAENVPQEVATPLVSESTPQEAAPIVAETTTIAETTTVAETTVPEAATKTVTEPVSAEPATIAATSITIAPDMAKASEDTQALAAATKAATDAAEYNEELLFAVEKNEARTMQSISQSKDVVATDIIGRWVSQSRLNNNTMQTWVIDIENGVFGLMARAELVSGALSQKYDKTDNRADLQQLFANATQVTDVEDINYETMCLFSNIDKIEVPVIVANNCVDIKFNTSKKYTTNTSRMMSSVFSLSKIKNVIQSIANSDDVATEMEEAVKAYEPFSFTAEVEFSLQFASTGLTGHATEIVADQNDGKTIIVTKHTFDTKFYRVDRNDQNIGVDVDLKKTDADLAEEQSLITRLAKEASHSSDIAYQLGLLLSKGLGDIDGKPNESETYKYMAMAANGGSIDAMKYLIASGYTIASDDSNSKAVRQKNIDIAEHWIKVLTDKSAAQAAVAQIPKAKYLLDSQNDFSSATKIYNVALATRAPEAMIAAGDFYLSNGKTDKAIELYNSAIDLGSSDAALSLARTYKETETSKYLDLVLQAHEKGNIEALNELYKIYLDGIGVDQDYHKANAYYMEYRRAQNKNIKKIIQALQQI
jgi:TPR repeat protein